MGVNSGPDGADLRAEGEAGKGRWLAGTGRWACLQTLHQLQQAPDGLCQVTVWYQLAGLQGRAAKSQCLAHKHKRKQTQQLQQSESPGRVKLTYIIILPKTGLQPGQINLSPLFSPSFRQADPRGYYTDLIVCSREERRTYKRIVWYCCMLRWRRAKLNVEFLGFSSSILGIPAVWVLWTAG